MVPLLPEEENQDEGLDDAMDISDENTEQMISVQRRLDMLSTSSTCSAAGPTAPRPAQTASGPLAPMPRSDEKFISVTPQPPCTFGLKGPSHPLLIDPDEEMRRIQLFIDKHEENMQIKARTGIVSKYAGIDLHNPRSDEDKKIINDMALQDRHV